MSRKYSEEQVGDPELTLGDQVALESGRWVMVRGRIIRERRRRLYDRRWLPQHPPEFGPTIAEVFAANPIERLLDYQVHPITDVDPESLSP